MSYPEGWTAQAATEPWTASTFPLYFGEPHADWLSDPILTSDLFLTIASQPIGDSTPEDWVAEQMASDEGCTATEPIAVDGGTGLIGVDAPWRSSQPLAAATGSSSIRLATTHSPSLPTTGHGSRRSLPRCNCIPRTPSTEGRRPTVARPSVALIQTDERAASTAARSLA